MFLSELDETDIVIVQESDTPFLDQYTENLTEKVSHKPEDYQVFGRDQEIEDVGVSLMRKTKNSPLLIGEAGVGKTAIVEGLAFNILKGNVPEGLQGLVIRSLELSSLMNDQDGGFIFKFKKIIEEMMQTKGQNLLFIDEIHTIMGAGGNGDVLDAGNVLKPALARGEIQIIGSTTLDEYHLSIERDRALERRFQKIQVNEPDKTEAIAILDGAKPTFEKFHQVIIDKDAIEQAVKLSIRYITDRFLPDKAFDLLDEAATIVSANGTESHVTEKDIATVIKRRMGIPVTTILKDEVTRLTDVEERLTKRVKGQNFAVESVSDAVTISKAGLQDENKPLATFLFLGTTGVGKTELAKALAEVLFDDERAMIRFDMSEYSQPGSSIKLLGTQTEKGTLTEEVKHHPYSIVLFDELEKADQEVHDLLLQILDDGRLTDGMGRLINFKNTLVIMTTNIGAEKIKTNAELKGDLENLSEREFQQFMAGMEIELQSEFRPEFINRIEYKIIFKMLGRDVIKEIAEKNLELLNIRMKRQQASILYSEEVLDYLADNGTDANNGARPLARLINRKVLAPIAEQLIQLPKYEGKTWLFEISVSGKAPNMVDELVDRRELVFDVSLR
ncbi:AAA family ATPase [Enterococcus diestrammenae]|uniref:ATP-dependent Clp protease ATP-binding subunit ClpC n=1 Tax=Enterococcus diestrammenae TaxID=1155073 RepID=A0ABV0F1S7_9ENTE|nr:ATP-dependent Clp protease ATP-binding subunit [Enterococcus diestrammenae]KAF1300053.1 AAA family ATPase [Enterococcus diestrammenae]